MIRTDECDRCGCVETWDAPNAGSAPTWGVIRLGYTAAEVFQSTTTWWVCPACLRLALQFLGNTVIVAEPHPTEPTLFDAAQDPAA